MLQKWPHSKQNVVILDNIKQRKMKYFIGFLVLFSGVFGQISAQNGPKSQENVHIRGDSAIFDRFVDILKRSGYAFEQIDGEYLTLTTKPQRCHKKSQYRINAAYADGMLVLSAEWKRDDAYYFGEFGSVTQLNYDWRPVKDKGHKMIRCAWWNLEELAQKTKAVTTKARR